ncbi:MAG TPA: hypothetical protein VD816_07850 [Ohtaekwangia sp.]|nr:hypothetical protein [Ohtaekwangia sp.]
MKIHLTLAAVLLVIGPLHAKKIPGKIVYRDKVVDVIFNIPFGILSFSPDYRKLQEGVTYYNAKGDREKIRAGLAREIIFTFKGKTIRMVSVNTPLDSRVFSSVRSKLFLKIEVDGALRLFTIYAVRHTAPTMNSAGGMSGGGSHTVEQYALQRGNEDLVQPYWLKFRKEMVPYFQDCPELADKIQKRELGFDDLTLIAAFYNSHCTE